MNNVINQAPFLRTSRSFPEDMHELALEVNKTYVDTASAVNNRTISIFPTTRPGSNGESWFVQSNLRQQGFRQVYPFIGPSPVSIPHGINFAQIYGFTKIYGTVLAGSNWAPLPYADTSSPANQISLLVTPTNIAIVAGAGVVPLVSGFVVLEWISFP